MKKSRKIGARLYGLAKWNNSNGKGYNMVVGKGCGVGEKSGTDQVAILDDFGKVHYMDAELVFNSQEKAQAAIDDLLTPEQEAETEE